MSAPQKSLQEIIREQQQLTLDLLEEEERAAEEARLQAARFDAEIKHLLGLVRHPERASGTPTSSGFAPPPLSPSPVIRRDSGNVSQSPATPRSVAPTDAEVDVTPSALRRNTFDVNSGIVTPSLTTPVPVAGPAANPAAPSPVSTAAMLSPITRVASPPRVKVFASVEEFVGAVVGGGDEDDTSPFADDDRESLRVYDNSVSRELDFFVPSSRIVDVPALLHRRQIEAAAEERRRDVDGEEARAWTVLKCEEAIARTKLHALWRDIQVIWHDVVTTHLREWHHFSLEWKRLRRALHDDVDLLRCAEQGRAKQPTRNGPSAPARTSMMPNSGHDVSHLQRGTQLSANVFPKRPAPGALTATPQHDFIRYLPPPLAIAPDQRAAVTLEAQLPGGQQASSATAVSEMLPASLVESNSAAAAEVDQPLRSPPSAPPSRSRLGSKAQSDALFSEMYIRKRASPPAVASIYSVNFPKESPGRRDFESGTRGQEAVSPRAAAHPASAAYIHSSTTTGVSESNAMNRRVGSQSLPATARSSLQDLREAMKRRELEMWRRQRDRELREAAAAKAAQGSAGRGI